MKGYRVFFLSLALLSVVLLIGTALAAGGYDLPWYTVDGGGGTSSGGGYALSGIIGQPDAGLIQGGDFTLGGGAWGGGERMVAGGFSLYLPVLMKNP